MGIVEVVLGRHNVAAYGCAADLISVRFKAVDLGYEWESYEDEGWKHIVYFLEPKHLALASSPTKKLKP